MNRAEAKIMVRDLIMVNVLNHFLGEGIGDSYREAIQQADAQIAAAMKESVGD